jgi:hypothetical protein
MCVWCAPLPAEECTCEKLDFVAAKALDKESLVQFTEDHSVILALTVLWHSSTW